MQRLHERAMPVGTDGKPAVQRREGQAPIRLFVDQPREILTRHDFGAHGVHYTLNPYRGCTVGCVYCSARPLHEYLGDGAQRWNAGADFDSRIVARPEAPALLGETLERGNGKRLRGRVIQISGATDPYQPLEASLGITRACLEVCVQHHNPVALQTKCELVLRDRDLLLALHRGPGVHVAISLSSLDEARAAALEPGAPTPHERLKLIERLAGSGIPVGISIAPAILGVTDTDIVRILTMAKDAGAPTAYYMHLKLPGLIEPALVRRVRASLPSDRARKVVAGLDGHGAAAPGRRATADDPMEQIFCFTAERLGLVFERGAPFPSTVARLEDRPQPQPEPVAEPDPQLSLRSLPQPAPRAAHHDEQLRLL
jgi:DNA repair photolyase